MQDKETFKKITTHIINSVNVGSIILILISCFLFYLANTVEPLASNKSFYFQFSTFISGAVLCVVVALLIHFYNLTKMQNQITLSAQGNDIYKLKINRLLSSTKNNNKDLASKINELIAEDNITDYCQYVLFTRCEKNLYRLSRICDNFPFSVNVNPAIIGIDKLYYQNRIINGFIAGKNIKVISSRISEWITINCYSYNDFLHKMNSIIEQSSTNHNVSIGTLSKISRRNFFGFENKMIPEEIMNAIAKGARRQALNYSLCRIITIQDELLNNDAQKLAVISMLYRMVLFESKITEQCNIVKSIIDTRIIKNSDLHSIIGENKYTHLMVFTDVKDILLTNVFDISNTNNYSDHKMILDEREIMQYKNIFQADFPKLQSASDFIIAHDDVADGIFAKAIISESNGINKIDTINVEDYPQDLNEKIGHVSQSIMADSLLVKK
jgi:hypothetical protein